jgi:hypothetical protein
MAEGNLDARCVRETEFWRSGMAQNPGDFAGVDPIDLGNLGKRHAVLHQDPMTCCGWRLIPHQSEDRYRPFWS